MAQLILSSSPWPALNVLAQRLIPAHREAIAGVMAWLESVGEQHQWPARTLFALTLCADEALTNIASHAHAPAGESLQVQLLVGYLDGGFALAIADNGAAFDPTAQTSAPLAESLEDAEMGGHGLRLMRHYLQRFEYQRSEARNWLLMGMASPDTTS